MASSSAVTSPFDSLPDEVVLKIVKMATRIEEFHYVEYDHDFLLDVICKLSVRFKRLATDSSMWRGHVGICTDGGLYWKAEFVVQECLNEGTEEFTVLGDDRQVVEMVDPTTKFPNLKLVLVKDRVGYHVRLYKDKSLLRKNPLGYTEYYL